MGCRCSAQERTEVDDRDNASADVDQACQEGRRAGQVGEQANAADLVDLTGGQCVLLTAEVEDQGVQRVLILIFIRHWLGQLFGTASEDGVALGYGQLLAVHRLRSTPCVAERLDDRVSEPANSQAV